MSNWNQNSRMASTAAATAGPCPLYTMGQQHTKPLLSVDGGGVSSKRSFSTMGIGIVGSLLQRVALGMANMFIPTVPQQINTLERNKQSLSAPDIFVDISINAPIFEAANGKAKLTIPDEDKPTCDQTKSLSVGNSPFDWCPIRDQLDPMRNSADREALGRRRKRMKSAVGKQETSSSMGRESSIRPRRPPVDRYFQVHSSKPKECNSKNRKEKDRYNLLIDIMEDVRQISDDNQPDSESESNSPLLQGLPYELRESFCSISFSPKNKTAVLLDLSEKSFPSIRSPPKPTRGRKTHPSESSSESENSFVIFSEDVQMTTPSESPPPTPIRRRDLCTTINNFFIPPALKKGQRQRQISECSDDSIVFCYESDDQDEATPICDFDSEDEDSEDEEETDDDEEEDDDGDSAAEDSEDTVSHQPDSGFEEKKVQFNLKPEVHVMRTWDFAYRQARKGEWEMAARDRERFKKRIHETENVLSIVFDKNLRDRVYEERFNN